MSEPTPVAAGQRISWFAVPVHVRSAVEEVLGSPVASARTQHGGFSPGAAARLVCVDGRRAFVKACGTALNPDSPGLHRDELRTLRSLPSQVPAPALLGGFDDGDWVALVLEDIEGRHPALPWTDDDVEATTAAFRVVADTPGDPTLPPFAEVSAVLTSWSELARDPVGVDPAVLGRVPAMLTDRERLLEETAGETLVHWDARADNVLIRDGSAVLLDWAWGCRGARWLDTLMLAVEFVIQGGPEPDDYLLREDVTAETDPQLLRAMVGAMAGFWLERVRRPAPPGLPTIRRWQAHCAARTLLWLDTSKVWA